MLALSPYAKNLAKSLLASLIVGAAVYIAISAYNSAIESVKRTTVRSYIVPKYVSGWDYMAVLRPDPLATKSGQYYFPTLKINTAPIQIIPPKPMTITISDSRFYDKVVLSNSWGEPVMTRTKNGWEISKK